MTNISGLLKLLAGKIDTGIRVEGLRKSAQYYGCDFVVVPEAGHNRMMEPKSQKTAEIIRNWLAVQEDRRTA